MFKKIFIAFIVFIISNTSQAQRFKVLGEVTDEFSGNLLSGVYIIDAKHQIGTISNEQGFFALELPFDSVLLKVSHIGYKDIEVRLKPNKDIFIHIKITKAPFQRKYNLSNPFYIVGSKNPLTHTIISAAESNKLPQILTNDLLKSTQYYPGFQKIMIGSSIQNIRGSGFDQNQITYDGVPVYHPYHLLGVYSIFDKMNSQSATINRSEFDPKYGGGLSSNIQVKSKQYEGVNNASLGFDILFLKAAFETKINSQSNLIGSIKRTYIDGLGILSTDSDYIQPVVQDLFLKYTYKFKTGHLLTLNTLNTANTVVTGNIQMIVDDNGNSRKRDRGVDLGQKNKVYNAELTKIYNKKAIHHYQAYYTKYDFYTFFHSKVFVPGNIDPEKSVSIRQNTGITDMALKFSHSQTSNYNKGFTIGGQIGVQRFNIGTYKYKRSEIAKPDFDSTYYSNIPSFLNIVAFASGYQKLQNNYTLKYGGRITFLTGNASFIYIDPRVSLHKYIDSISSFEMSYDVTHQHYHTLSQNNYGMGIDNMVPASKYAPVQRMQQLTLTYTKKIHPRYTIYSSAYLRDLRNQVLLTPGIDNDINESDWSNKLSIGKGTAFGIECMIKKTEGLTTGWISYTYTHSRRTFENINNGLSFPYFTNRAHELNFVAINRIGKKNFFTICYSISSGNPITSPAAKYQLPQSTNILDNWNAQGVSVKSGFNNYTTPLMSRVDIAFQLERTSKIWKETSVHFSVYNLLNQLNAFDVRLEKASNSNLLITNGYRLFGIVPSITYYTRF